MIILGQNQYGKAETRLLRVTRHADRHEIKDLGVSVTLSGDFADAHLTGDNGKVLPTDSQKNTVFAFAKEHGIADIESFGIRLARHFVDSRQAVRQARVSIEEYPWDRVARHSFVRDGREVRTATITAVHETEWVISGLRDLVVLKSTGSEFRGFVTDRYTTLQETGDRILATAIEARWRHMTADADWTESHRIARDLLVETFARTYSHSLQQTLYAMGRQVLERLPGIAEIRLSMPNRHHFLADLTPFGLGNDGEVFFVADRPYGLIEGTVTRDDVPPAKAAW